jgi:hypothetical protein
LQTDRGFVRVSHSFRLSAIQSQAVGAHKIQEFGDEADLIGWDVRMRWSSLD